MRYQYKAIDSNGVNFSGVVEAQSHAEAESLVAEKGYIPLNIVSSSHSKRGLATQWFQKQVKLEDLILFTKQFQAMVDAGVPILRTFSILEEQTEHDGLRAVVGVIRKDVEEGADLYDAFSKHDTVFSSLYCSLLQAGEKSGSLSQVLNRLYYITSHEAEIKRQVRSATRYPVIVLSFLGFAFFGLLTFVIPRFMSIFKRAGIDLPLPTKVCVILSDWINNYWWAIGLVLVSLIASYKVAIKHERVKFYRDLMLLRCPVFGVLIQKSVMSRFASIFGILQSSGISVLSSLDILDKCLNNEVISRQFKTVKERLEQGEGIATPLKDAEYFPPLLTNMVAIGEESGRLEDMLRDIAAHYDVEVEFAVKRLVDILPTLLTIGLAVVVGFFALAIYMPMWDLTKLAKR